MLGNTGFIGYPVILLLPQLGLEGFGWALFYDAMGTLLGSYGLGAVLAQGSVPGGWQQGWRTILRNPILAAFGLGLLLRPLPLPTWLDTGLYRIAWLVVGLSLLLMGLRIQQLRSWQHLPRATVAIAIKMVLAPLMVGLALTALGIGGVPRLVMVLQAGMPSAFANLVLAETYDLDRDLAVTCVGLSSASLLVTLPLWLWGFPA
jgi:predicted permease